jgi:NAD(P)-dependent dehydrogenase (short-subunit alcohol dehydrogenase family)
MLAAQGWHVIAVGRDPGRTAEAGAEIRGASVGGRVDILRGDLSLMADARRLADEIAELTDRVDVLINNAGGITDRLVMTNEGLEANFAGNHLGPFVLTNRLLALLQAAATDAPAGAVRIIQTSSEAHEMIPSFDLDDMQGLKKFDPGMAYCAGKLANMLFTRALAARLAGTGIVAHAMTPGPTASRFFSYASKETQEYTKNLPMVTEEQGADTLIWLATAEEPGRSTGGYWKERLPRKPHALADNAAVLTKFWQESERLVASAGSFVDSDPPVREAQ